MAIARSTAASARSREQLDRYVLQICTSVGEFIAWWGFKAIHGRVWALLALRREPMSQADIARMLGVSRALVSSAIHELEGYNLVSPVGEGRNAPWQAVLDVWPVIGEVLRTREWVMVESARTALEAAIAQAELALELGEDIDYDLGRMRLLLALTETAHGTLRLLVSLSMPRSVDNLRTTLGKAGTILRALRTRSQQALGRGPAPTAAPERR